MSRNRRRGFILLEVVTAAALIALISIVMFCAVCSALQIYAAARAVTRGRLLAASHLALAAAGQAEQYLEDGGLISTLTCLKAGDNPLWQAEVQGDGLPQALRLVGGP